jgi:hypothetical protein
MVYRVIRVEISLETDAVQKACGPVLSCLTKVMAMGFRR